MRIARAEARRGPCPSGVEALSLLAGVGGALGLAFFLYFTLDRLPRFLQASINDPTVSWDQGQWIPGVEAAMAIPIGAVLWFGHRWAPALAVVASVTGILLVVGVAVANGDPSIAWLNVPLRLPILAGLLWYFTRPGVRAWFAGQPA